MAEIILACGILFFNHFLLFFDKFEIHRAVDAVTPQATENTTEAVFTWKTAPAERISYELLQFTVSILTLSRKNGLMSVLSK